MVLPDKIPEKNGVIIAIDLDNLLISSAQAGQKLKGYNTEAGFHKMFEWIQTFGKIFCVHFYLSSWSHHSLSDDLWHNLWEKYKKEFLFEFIYCPKRRPIGRKKADNVDNHLIYHTKKMIEHFGDQVQYFCLGSGDLDYSPLLCQLKREQGIKIAFALGSEDSFSKAYREMGIIGKNPITDEDLIHYFSPNRDS